MSEVKYAEANSAITDLFEFLENSNKDGVRRENGVVYELLRDLRGTLDAFLK